MNALGFDTTDGYAVTRAHHADAGGSVDLDNSRWINQSGNSGHAYHPNYDDQLPLWVDNQLLPFPFTRRGGGRRRSTHRLELVPSG